MRYRAAIDGVTITSKHIMSVSTSEISLNFAGDKLISSKTTIELSNVDYSYDDRQGTGGLFEAIDWYNSIVIVYDDETDELLWEGRLKKVEIDDGKMVTRLTVNDFIQDLVDTVCVINLLNVTPAEAVWEILTDASRLAIPESRLIKSGFEIGISQQQGTKLNVIYTTQANEKCIAVLEKLCKGSASHLFQRDNKIGFWVWTQYTGILGTPIYNSDILPGSYSQYTDDALIFNQYSIAWNNVGTVAYSTGTDSASSALYGAGKQFAIPEDSVEDTSASAFKILYVSSAGAAEIGAKILARHKDIKKICKFTTGYHLNYISLGDILDLRYSPFTREPVRVTSFKPSRDKRQIEFTCEYVNYPEIVPLDLVAPDPVQMFEALYFEGSVLLRWSKCNKDDLMLYKLYFSTSEGYWGTEFNGGRFSPITIPLNSVVDIEGDCLYIFTPVDPEKTYYFRVSATDTSYNESEKSNTVSLTAPIDVEQNLYNPLLDEYGSLWTTYGGAVVSTAVKKFGKRSLYLDGINSHLYKSINISGNKWCIEGEFYLTATPANGASLFQCGNKNIYVIRSSSNYKVSLYLSSNGTTWDISFNLLSSTVMDLNKFYHIALEYDGTKYVLYINGIPEITKVSSVNILAASYCRIASPTYYATKGYVDEVRITVGAIRYGGAFTPSLSRFPKDSLGTTNALLHFETGPDDSENRYNLAGNPYQGFILDMTNPGAGSGNTEWAEYDIAEFDTAEFTPTAVYQSAVLRKIGGYNRIIYRTIGGPGDVMIQYRTYSSGIFGAWSDLQDCYNTTTLDLQGNEFIQYRVVFNSPNWTDSDKFMIKEVS